MKKGTIRKHGACLERGSEAYRLWSVWQGMKQRCQNPRSQYYGDYGGRGIAVCERWMDFASFLSDMGPRPDGGMLDRINNDLGYSPSNCRWVNRKVQNVNRRNVRLITFDGQTMCLADWARKLGRNANVIKRKIFDEGRPLEEVLIAYR